jgi:hypothetical protein
MIMIALSQLLLKRIEAETEVILSASPDRGRLLLRFKIAVNLC